jgi:WD40 repeat protein
MVDQGSSGVTVLSVHDSLGALIAGNGEGRVRVFDSRTKIPRTEWVKTNETVVTDVRLNADGQSVTSADNESKLCFTELPTRARTCRPMTTEGSGTTVYVGFNGKILGYVSERGVAELRNPMTFELVGSPLQDHVNPSTALSFSPDGKTIAAICGSSSHSVCIWETGSATSIKIPVEGDGAASVSFDATGRSIAVGTWDRRVFQLSLASKSIARGPFVGHIGPVLKTTFSPDGKILASAAGGDSAIHLWDLSEARLHETALQGHENTILSLTFTADSKSLISGGTDGQIIWWDLDEASWSYRACQMANRKLTKQEWSDYVGQGARESVCPKALEIGP